MVMSKIKVMAEPLNHYPVPEFHIALKTKGTPMSDRKRISSSGDVNELLRTIISSDHIEWFETFIIICLNRANKPVGFYRVSTGGVAGTVADPKIIFQCALLCNASGIILAHNHPSGNMMPSQADIDLTKKLKEGGKCLEIQVLDHLIVGADRYCSMADEGLM